MDTLDLTTNDLPSYDRDGKLSLDHVYNSPTPRGYFSALRQLDYRVPQLAKPFFQRLLAARRDITGQQAAKVIDVGCSYGVNAALLKHDFSLDELYRLYADLSPEDARGLKTRDQALFADFADETLTVVGVDPAENAVGYAVDVGLIDAAITTNLEEGQPSSSEARAIDNADMIISTGCVGYVTETSLEQLVDAGNEPWMANFVLRMFDYEPFEEMMAARGYVTEKLNDAMFRQRRFATAAEQDHVLDNLEKQGRDPEPAEREGWYLAELYVSRPQRHAGTSIEALLVH